MRRARIGTIFTLGSLILLGVALYAAGCKLDTEGAGVFDIPCSTDSQCNDKNPCTQDACGARGVCTFTPNPAASPDDANDCTADSCSGTSAVHEPVNEGDVCQDGTSAGICHSGECTVVCNAQNAATACDDGNPCTIDDCDLTSGRCTRVKLDGTPTPGVSQKTGDCKRSECAEGIATEIVDDTDLPVNVECWEESCSSGVPGKTPSPADEPCGWDKALKCDGAGNCEGCQDAAQCPRTNCSDGVCNAAGICELDPKPAGTALPDSLQQANDCQSKQCDGAGDEVSVADDNDPPQPDTNDCTRDECVGGVPLHPPRAKNAACNQSGGSFCDGAGTCVECNDALQCDDPGECSTRVCTGNLCKVAPKASGEPCGTSGSVCDGAGTCVGCNHASDCTDPGECQHPVCSSNTCGAAPDPEDQACSAGFCDASGKCVQCNTPAQCPAGDACNDPKCTSGVCSLTPKPPGSTCPAGVCNASGACVQCIAASGCPDPGECTSPACNNGTCGVVNDDKSTTCGTGWHCDGAGTCVECNTDAQCTGGTTCLPVLCADNACANDEPAAKGTPCGSTPGTQECDGAGACKLGTGQPCSSSDACVGGHCVDGFCCDTPCTGLCEACSAAIKGQGANGTCGPIESGTDPEDECNGSHTCTGAGDCT